MKEKIFLKKDGTPISYHPGVSLKKQKIKKIATNSTSKKRKRKKL